ncbi:MAG TPA: Fic family protein [Candidatus Caccalectryoclostridium excrementigallinarum]|uniref:Fic family protein n=1 Tax=Candidatus Caccalectryoclostridium excrementigallinarum TaxID=2840710 RepID=A0A9D1SKV9_9FIRM|nr:Fic family protein [Candidatus Caccalectryoclostridium excrementigallinarum]
MSKSMDMQQKYRDIIERLDVNYKKIKTMRPLPAAGVAYFRNEFAISTTHNSNAIEGNTFTYDETKLLLEKGITSSARSFREHEDIVGYKKGFDFLYEALKQGTEISEDFVKRIHSFVQQGAEDAGEYRTIQNYIGDLSRVVYTPCSPREVPDKMKDYIQKVRSDSKKNKDLMARENIEWEKLFHGFAEHHIEFERIHPFTDGNGRTGRLLLTYEMISLGLVPVDIRYDERSRYYAALAAYEDKLRYSTRPESKTEKLAKLLAECELRSSDLWIKTFSDYCQADASGTEKADQAGQASASSPGGKGKGKASRGK